MKSSEQIESLLKERIAGLNSEIAGQRRTAVAVCSLSAVPLVALALVALKYFDAGTGMAPGLLSAICGIGLTIIIWNIGSNCRDRAHRAEGDRERMENLRLCLLALPDKEIKVSELMAMISRRENPFEALRYSGSLTKGADDGKEES